MTDTDDISALLGILSGNTGSTGDTGGNGENGDTGGIFGNIDPELLFRLLELVTKLGDDDKNTALLNALRPHLRAENRAKLDRAARIMKLVSVIGLLRESGMADELFGGGR
ncbi:MAG: hypothetical protein IJT87_09525 [Ruminiclostridium sp.]|nr:hypothetical protein [Ruminiclostridium sp.]